MVNLLRRLQIERDKFTQSDQNKMQDIIDILLEQGIYHTPKSFTVLSMVENYGVYWNQYEEPHFCPHCSVDLRGNEPPFKRELNRYSIELDRVTEVVCPDCREVIMER